MNRYRTLIFGAIALLVVACTTPAASAGPSDNAPASGAAASADASSGATGGAASAACTEAFAPIADLGLESTSDLGDLTDEIPPTVTGCESVADWMAGAEAAVGAPITEGAAKILLDIQCADTDLADSEVCVDLAAL